MQLLATGCVSCGAKHLVRDISGYVCGYCGSGLAAPEVAVPADAESIGGSRLTFELDANESVIVRIEQELGEIQREYERLRWFSETYEKRSGATVTELEICSRRTHLLSDLTWMALIAGLCGSFYLVSRLREPQVLLGFVGMGALYITGRLLISYFDDRASHADLEICGIQNYPGWKARIEQIEPRMAHLRCRLEEHRNHRERLCTRLIAS